MKQRKTDKSDAYKHAISLPDEASCELCGRRLEVLCDVCAVCHRLCCQQCKMPYLWFDRDPDYPCRECQQKGNSA